MIKLIKFEYNKKIFEISRRNILRFPTFSKITQAQLNRSIFSLISNIQNRIREREKKNSIRLIAVGISKRLI